MRRHVFDPLSAVLGVLAVVVGLLTAVGGAADLDVNVAWLITAGAIMIGLAIIPWRRQAPPQPTPEQPLAGLADPSIRSDPNDDPA
jgi:hypothetical protein